MLKPDSQVVAERDEAFAIQKAAITENLHIPQERVEEVIANVLNDTEGRQHLMPVMEEETTIWMEEIAALSIFGERINWMGSLRYHTKPENTDAVSGRLNWNLEEYPQGKFSQIQYSPFLSAGLQSLLATR
jgi:hypothetical protein